METSSSEWRKACNHVTSLQKLIRWFSVGVSQEEFSASMYVLSMLLLISFFFPRINYLKSQLNTYFVAFSCLNLKLFCYFASNLYLAFCLLCYTLSQIIINDQKTVRSCFLLRTKKAAFDILCCHCGRTVKPLCRKTCCYDSSRGLSDEM